MGKRKRRCNRKVGVSHKDSSVGDCELHSQKAEVVDEDSSVSKGLRIPLILQEIFKQLPASEVLKCCLVNKLWCSEARKGLRDQKMCPFRTRPESACHDLKVLESLLPKLSTVHYNGLSITVDDNKHDQCCGPRMDLSKLCYMIPSLMRLKYLEVNWEGWGISRVCPAIKLFISLLLQKTNAGNLEYVYLRNLKDIRSLYRREDIRGMISLPRLKIIKTDRDGSLYGPLGLLEDLVLAAPNLQELRMGFVSIYQLRWLPQERYHLVKRLAFNIFQRNSEDICHKFALSKPRLHKLAISPPEDFTDEEQLNELNIRRWLETLRLLFENSSPILEFLDVDALTLTILMRLPGIPPAEKLKNLTVLWDFGSAYSPVRARLKNLPFSVVFPNVSLVKVQIVGPSSPPPGLSGMNHRFNTLSAEEEDFADAGHRPPKLQLDLLRPEKPAEYFGSMIEDVAEVFPHVTCLIVDCYDEWDDAIEEEDPQDILESLPYHKFWTSWPNLEELEIREEIYPNSTVNHDAEFLGIHPQEVRELQRKNNDFLKAVHIVPIQPSIINLTHLRKLNLVLNGTIPAYKTRSRKPPYLSNVTGILAFQRMPGLQVTIETPKIPGGLDHLAPFVTAK